MASAFQRTFESLTVTNYRRFFFGQIVSWTGTWVQWVAQAWLVLRITDSGFGLGLITALQWLPVLVFGAWAGVVADRFEKRKLLIITNVTSGVLSLVLGLVTVAGAVNLLNHETVVVGGDMAQAYDVFVAGLRESLYANATALSTRELQILPATHGQRAGVVGCASLALEHVLDATAVDRALSG